MFSGRTVLITGGTGSFGSTFVRNILPNPVDEIRILSRDEEKQDRFRRTFNDPRLKFYIADVRDKPAVSAALRGVDFCFHAAALKQVPSCEFHPMEAVKTNILGTENVLTAAIEAGVRRVVCLSTDKAVYPINAMGISKAMMEKVMVGLARQAEGGRTVIVGTRYGNVMASRGSVIPLFVEQMLADKPITMTHGGMTRFMMSLEDAIELVLHAFAHGSNGDIFVHKAPASSLAVLADAVRHVFGAPDHQISTIGVRHGEKVHECLLSREEMARVEDQGDYFRLPPDMRDLRYEPYFEEGDHLLAEGDDYSSANARRLNRSGMMELLQKLPIVQDALAQQQRQMAPR